MKFINLDYSEYRMYNPVKNEVIIEEDCDDDAESLIAYWFSEVFDEPLIKDDLLRSSWEEFSAKYEAENDDTPGYEELEKFLSEYDAAEWIVYIICSSGIACGPISNTGWFVVDKDTLVEEIYDENAY